MKKLSLSQMKILSILALSLALVMGFQNCAKTSFEQGDEKISPIGTLDLAANDPLKAEAAIDENAGNEQDGALYILESIRSGSNGSVAYTAGAFTLRFSAATAATLEKASAEDSSQLLEIMMKDVKFQATSGCYRHHEGQGRMARFKNLPVQMGAIEMKVTSSVDVKTFVPCDFQMSAMDQALADKDGLVAVMENARAYAIFNQRLALIDGQGQQAVFRRMKASDDLGAAFKNFLASWTRSAVAKEIHYPNRCEAELAPGEQRSEICTMELAYRAFSKRHVLNLAADGVLTIQASCGAAYTARLAASDETDNLREGEVAVKLVDLSVKSGDDIIVQGCESLSMKETQDLMAHLIRLKKARFEDGLISLVSSSGASLILVME